MRIALFNDTGNYPHIGCLAVSDAHNRMLENIGVDVRYRFYVNECHEIWRGTREDSIESLRSNSIMNSCFKEVDAVVVNGEGTIHHGAGLHLLTILEYANMVGKGTFLINSVLEDSFFLYPPPKFLDDLVVRDIYSQAYAIKSETKPRLVLDSIVMAKFNDGIDENYLNKIIVTDCHHSRVDVRQQIDNLLLHFGEQAVYFPLEGSHYFGTWKDTLRKFRAAKLIITARHHGVYLALLAKKPIMAFPSITWKVNALMEMIGQKSNLWLGGDSIYLTESILKQSDYEVAPNFIKNLSIPLKTFDGLNKFFNKNIYAA